MFKHKNEHLPKTADHDNDDVASVLSADQQSFLESLASWDDSHPNPEAASDTAGDRPPLPPRIKTPDLTWDSDSESFVREDVLDRQKKSKSSSKSGKKTLSHRLSALLHSKEEDKPVTTKTVTEDTPVHAPVARSPAHLTVPGHADADSGQVTSEEAQREQEDLVKVLDNMHLKKQQKKDTKANEIVAQFVLVLKDLVNGVPTAADDLRHLLDDRDGTLQKGFDHLPKSLRKLVAQLPNKLTSSLAPELLAVAAESQGVKIDAAAVSEGSTSKTAAAKAALLPLVTKPGAVVKMLKAIMNALKLRWPAFAGTSAIWSVALSLLLFVLWYCHKRGREVRLEKEAAAAAAAGGEPLPAAALPPPPIGADSQHSQHDSHDKHDKHDKHGKHKTK